MFLAEPSPSLRKLGIPGTGTAPVPAAVAAGEGRDELSPAQQL